MDSAVEKAIDTPSEEPTVDDTKFAYRIMTALGESPDVPGSLEPGANRRVDIVARVLASRPTSSRRSVLEEAAREIERYSEGLIVDYQVVCGWLAERIRALAEE